MHFQGQITNPKNFWPKGQWALVTMTWSAADGLKHYVNGTLVQNTTSIVNKTLGFNGGLGTAQTGYGYSFSDQYMNGSIDELGIFQRTLSAEEIALIYMGNASTPVYSIDSASASYFNGYLMDVIVYNSTLSNTQVKRLSYKFHFFFSKPR